jgi:hypothetical protein
MHDSRFEEVILSNASIEGRLSMDQSTFTGKVDMEGLTVARDVSMHRSTFKSRVNLIFATNRSSLDLRGASLGSTESTEPMVFDLSGTTIKGELRLGNSRQEYTEKITTWAPNSKLALRNTRVGALRDNKDAWPDSLDLVGFTYDRLGGAGSEDPDTDMARRSISWLTEWLKRDPDYSPQPYHELANVFQATGQFDKANAIRYASRERGRHRLKGPKWLLTTAIKLTIGYGIGYRYFYSLAWVAGFVIMGVVVLWVADQLSTGVPWAFACSLDILLPVVELNEAHSQYVMQELGGNAATQWVRYYFYLHKLVGWMLGLFLIGGLTGLTQK